MTPEPSTHMMRMHGASRIGYARICSAAACTQHSTDASSTHSVYSRVDSAWPCMAPEQDIVEILNGAQTTMASNNTGELTTSMATRSRERMAPSRAPWKAASVGMKMVNCSNHGSPVAPIAGTMSWAVGNLCKHTKHQCCTVVHNSTQRSSKERWMGIFLVMK